MITGSQVKKGAQEEVDPEASQQAGGQTKMNTADIWVGIVVTEAMKVAGVMGFKFLKTRTSDGKGKIGFVEYNPVSMRLSNFEGGVSAEQAAAFKSLLAKSTKGANGQQKNSVVEDYGDMGDEEADQSNGRPGVKRLLRSMAEMSRD